MYSKLVTLFILLALNMTGQEIIQFKEHQQKLIRLSDDIQIPSIENGYTVWTPEGKTPVGLIVFFHSRMDTLSQEPIIEKALAQNLAVAYITSANRIEFFFDKAVMEEIHTHLRQIYTTLELDAEKSLFAGMSLAGTRALKMTIYSQRQHPLNPIVPKAIAICDSPLDMVRFYKEASKAATLKFNDIAANEGSWVSAYLRSNLGGTPAEQMSNYLAYSPYSYYAEPSVESEYFEKIHIRAYTEPDVDWWMQTRRKDYYGMNALDLAAFVNELNIANTVSAELINTQDKGYRPNGDRHPHSWSIVDEDELINWFLAILE